MQRIILELSKQLSEKDKIIYEARLEKKETKTCIKQLQKTMKTFHPKKDRSPGKVKAGFIEEEIEKSASTRKRKLDKNNSTANLLKKAKPTFMISIADEKEGSSCSVSSMVNSHNSSQIFNSQSVRVKKAGMS